MKCFYHSADLDGHCSGAIIKREFPQCEMIGINYGQEFPWDKIEDGEAVCMVDFTLQPFEQMERLNSMCNLVWIDHHKTEVEEARNRGGNIQGIQRVGIGACALVWEWLQGHECAVIEPMPEAVRLLAEYDEWNHSDPKALPFQYGFRMFENTWPDSVIWGKFLCPGIYPQNLAIDEVVRIGEQILKYEASQNEKFCRAYSFDTQFYAQVDISVKPLTAIVCNRGFTNSKVFESVWDPEKYDLMVTFCRLKPPAHKWTVSLYSDKPEIDCGAIARKFGGGGHKGAAGFQCAELPFEI